MAEPSSRPILYCRCAYAQVVPVEAKEAVLQRLCERGLAFATVADICEMSARRDPRLAELAAQPGLVVAACHPRAVRWLFHAGEAPMTEDVDVVNMRAEDPVAQLDKLVP